MDLDKIRNRYPDKKPVCFNYMRAREDIFSCVKPLSGGPPITMRWKYKLKRWRPHRRGEKHD